MTRNLFDRLFPNNANSQASLCAAVHEYVCAEPGSKLRKRLRSDPDFFRARESLNHARVDANHASIVTDGVMKALREQQRAGRTQRAAVNRVIPAAVVSIAERIWLELHPGFEAAYDFQRLLPPGSDDLLKMQLKVRACIMAGPSSACFVGISVPSAARKALLKARHDDDYCTELWTEVLERMLVWTPDEPAESVDLFFSSIPRFVIGVATDNLRRTSPRWQRRDPEALDEAVDLAVSPEDADVTEDLFTHAPPEFHGILVRLCELREKDTDFLSLVANLEADGHDPRLLSLAEKWCCDALEHAIGRPKLKLSERSVIFDGAVDTKVVFAKNMGGGRLHVQSAQVEGDAVAWLSAKLLEPPQDPTIVATIQLEVHRDGQPAGPHVGRVEVRTDNGGSRHIRVTMLVINRRAEGLAEA